MSGLYLLNDGFNLDHFAFLLNEIDGLSALSPPVGVLSATHTYSPALTQSPESSDGEQANSLKPAADMGALQLSPPFDRDARMSEAVHRASG